MSESNSHVDHNVEIQYPLHPDAERMHEFSLGEGYHLRTGTVIYDSNIIGADFQTGHNVIVRENNSIGDGVLVHSNTVINPLNKKILILCIMIAKGVFT